MSLFNISESSLNEYKLMILQEKKTREQYARDKFKKKYNFKPDKPGADTGTITKDGKTYRIDMKKSNSMELYDTDGGVNKVNRNTMADLNDKHSGINLGREFFKLKGSNKGSRRDAILSHEIGHQNLHNVNPENKTVDKKNRTEEVTKNVIKGIVKDTGQEASDKDIDTFAKYLNKNNNSSKEDKDKRNNSLNSAKKYETNKPHQNAAEYEADRYAANKTSEKAVKKGVRNFYKIQNSKKGIDNKIKNIKDTYKKSGYSYGKHYTIDRNEFKKGENKAAQDDMNQRSKALKDKELKKSNIYK